MTRRTIGLWCIKNQLADPFGSPVLDEITPLEACEIACWAIDEGFIEGIAAHDDDLVSWNPEKPEDDLDGRSKAYRQLRRIKEMLDNAGAVMNMMTCNLFGDLVFRRGGLTNPDARIRDIARLKVRRSLRIGSFLGARYFTYWVARDGFEVPVVVPWEYVFQWLADGLNDAHDYIAENNLCYENGSIEPKPNEPRGHMFLPTAGHAAGFITGKLKNDGFWGANPELRQHEAMTLLDPLTCISYLVAIGKLLFLHFGGQINGQFDDDYPPLVGPEGLKETAYMFWLLKRLGWKGPVEFDCHMLRSEGRPKDQTGCRKTFIKNCSLALAIALSLAERIPDNLTGSSEESRADLTATMTMCALKDANVNKLMRRGG